MAIGDVANPKRVRTQANERLDTVDADAFSVAAREHLDAYSRAIEATPRNVGSSTPTGFIFQGFGLTLNPTGASDNKVRVQSALGVAFDADGRMLIKETGVQVDLTLSAGNSQIYAYYIEDDSDTTVRRRISVSSPFTESGASQPTKFKSNVGFFVRTGDQTSIVASDVVNGATTPLCFLGVAINTAGAITMTGYNATTAPNGAFVTNRLISVTAPTTPPPNNTANGSIATMHGLVNAALYAAGQAVWKGSKNLTPSAANNFGAYTLPTVGLDGLFDVQTETTFTPVTKWRDWQQNTRFLVDNQGFPGGQISVKDENWFVPATVPVTVDPVTGYKIAGSAALTTSPPLGVSFTTSTDQWAVPLDRAPIPLGSIVTAVTVFYQSTNAANTLTGAFNVGSLSSNLVSRTVTTPNAFSSFDVMFQPASTQWRKAIKDSERIQLQLSCTISGGSINIYTIQVKYLVPPVGWTPQLGNGGTATADGTVGTIETFNILDPISGLNQRHVQLIARNASRETVLLSELELFVDDDVTHSMEFMVKTGTVIDGTNVCSPSIGYVSATGAIWRFFRNQADANWSLAASINGGSTGGSLDTGVAFASNTVYRMKLEFQGSNRNSTGFVRIRGWINGTLVATIPMGAVVVPAAVQLRLRIGVDGSTAGPYDIRIGRIHRAWNHLAAGDNV